MVIKEKALPAGASRWRYITIDEAHRIKNENSILSKTMRLFSSNYRLLITGRPFRCPLLPRPLLTLSTPSVCHSCTFLIDLYVHFQCIPLCSPSSGLHSRLYLLPLPARSSPCCRTTARAVGAVSTSCSRGVQLRRGL